MGDNEQLKSTIREQIRQDFADLEQGSKDYSLRLERLGKQLVARDPEESYQRFGYELYALWGLDFLRHDVPLTEPLKEFVIDVKAGRKKRTKHGPLKYKNYFRDAVICMAVVTAIRAGLNPYRNDASEPNSACDIVCESLEGPGIHLSYKAVAAIWADARIHVAKEPYVKSAK